MRVLSCGARFLAASPSKPSERTRYAQKAEARDDGPTGPVTINIARRVKLVRPSVQLPAGIHGCAVYKDFGPVGKGKRQVWDSMPASSGDLRQLDISGPSSVFRPKLGVIACKR